MKKLSSASSTMARENNREGCGFSWTTPHSHGHQWAGASVRYTLSGIRTSRVSRNQTVGGGAGGGATEIHTHARHKHVLTVSEEWFAVWSSCGEGHGQSHVLEYGDLEHDCVLTAPDVG